MDNIISEIPGPLLLVGGGGHCRAVIDVLESANMEIAGIVHGLGCPLSPVLGYPALGRDADLPALRLRFSRAVIAVGQIKSSTPRQNLFSKLRGMEFEMPSVVSPSAYVSRHASMGDGNVVMHMALINAGASLADNCIINSKSLVEHDCSIASHCHIAIGAILCGGVSVGSGSFIGAGAVIRQNVHIGKNVIIGCGANVHADIPDNAIIRGKNDV